MTHYPRPYRAYCKIPLTVETLQRSRITVPRAAALGVLLGFITVILVLATMPSAHAKGGHAAHVGAHGSAHHAGHVTHAAHIANLAHSPGVRAQLEVHGQGNVRHVGTAMLHTWVAKPHKL